ncbi:MAG: HD domain-containing protein [gamma proteobacterium symbiont of Bathyaustriella thionipta]|nr:HD domain-containing protein [gamma proteobacterium symbiont of Bathyaustriella thionipta]MCU7951138.1 HD domain-containing protein [gamma proteobacterium symbiont of Bathyaustriella thionipta]MCU7954887.1 HD domain-containing protein [gamma proteobacterium symbiont of Bathyaustriella thionipta]MCU7957653.1 HD domain-containing protein [gamma proteobacterium symbiont of Bathyaustriella thionipta]MCU7965618.1 HD domain-containing protein [gamma proteobacterium symbiont of Bathyaustriella thio
MGRWNQDNYLKAWNFASAVHNGQRVPGSEIPYINHIGLVAMEAMAVIAQDNSIKNPDLLVQCALLHDVIEDTEIAYSEVASEFGTAVANGVLALSKNKDIPEKIEQMQDSLKRIKQQPAEIWMVKLCDRITNLQPPPAHWNKEKINTYREEAGLILKQLGNANKLLAARLQVKIAEYS